MVIIFTLGVNDGGSNPPNPIVLLFILGEMAEWFKVTVLKTVVC